MKDFRGQELKVGDRVAVALASSSYATYMSEYVVSGFCKRSGYDCVILNNANDKWSWDRNIVKACHKIAKLG